MRSALVYTLAGSLVIAGMPTMPSYAQSGLTTRGQAASPDSAVSNAALIEMLTPAVIVDTFRAFPNGGEQLSKRVADLIVKHPKLAPELASYVVKAPNLTRAQKVAAEHGFAAAMDRLGIKAADLGLPAKAPPPPAEQPVVEEEAFNPAWLLLVAALIAGGVVCALECFHHHAVAPPATPS